MYDAIYNIARNVREDLISKYGSDLAGHCIESSDEIARQIVTKLGMDAVTKEGWCRFDEESYGSDHPWDPHTWVEVPSLHLYVDATADQFNPGMYPENQYPDILVNSGLPFGMQYAEPTWEEYEQFMEEDASVSRDFTPEELYLVEQNNIKNNRGSLWDFMENTHWNISGETFPLCTKEALDQRKEYPLLGRLYNQYDKLYAFLSKVKGGMELLDRHEKELSDYIESGKGDPESATIKWFKGELDPCFYYSVQNDQYFYASVQDEVGKLFRFDPSMENCFWFSLNEDKCISVWLYPDDRDGDQLLMKLEEKAEDGSMGAHCTVLIDESYTTGDLSKAGISECLKDIYWDAGLGEMPEEANASLSEHVMAVFGLCKRSLDEQIQSAAARGETPGKKEPELMSMPGTTAPDWGKKHWGSER